MYRNARMYEPYPHRRMIRGPLTFRQDTPARVAATTIGIVSSVPGEEAVRQRPPPFGGRQSDSGPSPPGTTSRSEPVPARPNHTPRHNQREQGLLDAHVLPGIDDSPGPRGPGGAAPPRTSRSEGDSGATRPAARSASSIPSAMCTVAGGGVAATCVSPRSNLGGWARQLEVATQYLNRSLVVPTPPRQQNDNPGGRARPATAQAVVRAGHQGFSAEESGCGIVGESRPQTTPAGAPRERRQSRGSPLDGGLSRSSVEVGGDCRYGDMNVVSSGLSSRPLVSSRAASGATGGRTLWRSASISPSPRRPVVVVSPRTEQRPESLVRNTSSLRLVASPTGAPASQLHSSYSLRQNAARCDFEHGVNSIGEVGYTIASAAAAVGGFDSEENGHDVNPTDGNNSVQTGPLNETQLFVTPRSPGSVHDERSQAACVAAAAVPKLQLEGIPGGLGAKRAQQVPSDEPEAATTQALQRPSRSGRARLPIQRRGE